MSLEEDAGQLARTREETEASLRAEGSELMARLRSAAVEPVELVLTGGTPVAGWILAYSDEGPRGLWALFTSPGVSGTALTTDGLQYRYDYDHKGIQRVRGDQVPFDDSGYRSTLVSSMASVLVGTFHHADEPTFSDALAVRRWRARWGWLL